MMSIVSIFIMLFSKTSVLSIMGQFVFVLAWTWFLNFFCDKGLTILSWILVISPYIILFTAMATGLIKIETKVKVEEPKKEDEKKKESFSIFGPRTGKR
jgi:predicted membrane protein